MQIQPWLLYALLAAVCASAVNILGKVGMKGIDSDLATGSRSIVQALFVSLFCVVIGAWNKFGTIHAKSMTMIILSGVAGGLSWIFAFRAIQLADVSKVAPIDKLSMPLGILLAVMILGERPSGMNWVGIALITGGAYLATLK